MAENNLQRNDHLSPQSMGAFISSTCTDEERSGIEQHCLQCADCRQQLAMISQSIPSDSRPDDEMYQSPNFDSLLLIGEQAAQRVRQQQRMATASTIQAEHPRPMIPEKKTGHWLTGWASAWQWAAAAAVLLVLALPGYLLWQRNQPVTHAMESLRRVWATSRPIEARVTGDFPYLPYQVTRGGNEAVPVNEQELLAATAELAREVADNPSARSRHAMGRLHLLKSEYDRAEEQLKLVIQAEPRNAQAYADLATVHYERGTRNQDVVELSKAAEHLRKATELLPQMTEAWFNLALCHEQMMLFTQAKADWERYLQLDASSKWADEARSRLQKLQEKSALREPDLKPLTDRLKAASNAANEAEISRLVNENFSEIAALITHQLMDDYLTARTTGDQPEAERQLQLMQRLAGAIRQSRGDYFFADLVNGVSQAAPGRIAEIVSIRALLKNAEAANAAGKNDQAVSLFSTACQDAIRIADTCHEELAMIGLVRINVTQKTETPETARLRNLLIARTHDHRHLMHNVIALLSAVNQYQSRQMFATALATSTRAYEVARQINDRISLFNALRFIGGINSDLGRDQAALGNKLAALSHLFSQSPPLLRACQAYYSIAETLHEDGYHQAALDYQIESQRYCEACGNEMLAIGSLGRTGSYYAQTNADKTAVQVLNKAIDLSRKYQDQTGNATFRPDLFYSLGTSYLKLGQPAQAEAAFQQVLKDLGNKQFYLQSALFQGLALASLQLGKTDQAEQQLLQGIQLTEQTQQDLSELNTRNAFSASRQDIYHTMIGLQYFHRNATDRAFDFAENSRSREMLALLAGSVRFQPDQVEAFLQYSRSSPPLTLKQIQMSLPADVQLVEYAMLDDRLLIWVISTDRSETVSVPVSRKRLEESATQYLSLVSSRSDLQTLQTVSADLYRLLIAPIATHLNQQQVLAIVPDGRLQAIPFAALFNSETGHYLVQDFPLLVNPSASVMIRMQQLSKTKSKAAAGSLLTLSNPQFDVKLYPDLKALPGTEKETAGIRSFYSAGVSLARETATRDELLRQAGNFETVHLAAHSITNAQNPLLSSIILSGRNQQRADELNVAAYSTNDLQVREIFGLKLRQTRLVVLSSCQSAVNPALAGNGTGSLAHAFFSAGVPTVVASLWNVEDESTAELMKSFHYARRIEHRQLSTSLQQAQLKLLASATRQWHHPYYWAAFQVAGDGRGA